MALAEIGARLRLQGAPAFRRDAQRAAGATDRLGREIGQLDRQAGRAKRGLAGLGRGMSGLARTAGGLPGLLGAAAGGGLAVFGLSLLDTATQLEGLGSKAKIVFGSELAGVEKWANRSAEAMGLSASQAVGLAAGLSDLLVPIGFTRKNAAKMGTELLGLSGALAQWSGGQYDASEVAGILQGAMLGETDALQSLGIAISAADVEAALLAKGQSELTGNALKQAEAQAIIGLVYEKSTDAQKAYKDGSNKLGLAQARLSSKVQTLRERFATKLTPFFLDALGWVERHMPSIETKLDGLATSLSSAVQPGSDFRQQMRDLWPHLRDAAKFAGSVLGKLSDLVGWMTKHETAVKTFAGAVVAVKVGLAGMALVNYAATIAGIGGVATAAGAAQASLLGPLGLVAALGVAAAAIEGFMLYKASQITEGGTPRSPGYGEQWTDPKTGKPVDLPGSFVPGKPLPKGSQGDWPGSTYVYKPPIKNPPASATSNMMGAPIVNISPAPVTMTWNNKVVGEGVVQFVQDKAARR